MPMQEVTLIKKISLTHDVFELHYNFPQDFTMLAGQFVTFILPDIWGRAYSILDKEKNIIKLIIKRRSKDDGGRWGSIFLCDANEWDTFKAVWPTGGFTLQETGENKLFIGTGTGFVPLYNQIITGLTKNEEISYNLIFWVRNKADIFYLDTLEKLKQQYSNFSYTLCVSREDIDGTHHWYVTDIISADIVEEYKEYYICGMPQMIESSINTLHSLWVDDQSIHFEKYA